MSKGCTMYVLPGVVKSVISFSQRDEVLFTYAGLHLYSALLLEGILR